MTASWTEVWRRPYGTPAATAVKRMQKYNALFDTRQTGYQAQMILTPAVNNSVLGTSVSALCFWEMSGFVRSGIQS